jgi:hypothetical protein
VRDGFAAVAAATMRHLQRKAMVRSFQAEAGASDGERASHVASTSQMECGSTSTVGFAITRVKFPIGNFAQNRGDGFLAAP